MFAPGKLENASNDIINFLLFVVFSCDSFILEVKTLYTEGQRMKK
jgi:hypothetical protein